jgi:ribosomal protein L3
MADLPTEVSVIDARELEVLQLRAEKAKAQLEALQLQVEREQMRYAGAVEAFRARAAEAGKVYQFDPAKDIVNYDTLKIERR